MEIHLKWTYAEGDYNTKTMRLIDVPGDSLKGEREASICIADGVNLEIGTIDLGAKQIVDSNKLAEEIVRRFNEFPERTILATLLLPYLKTTWSLNMKRGIKIRQATKIGFTECCERGCFDSAYPSSKSRRGRV